MQISDGLCGALLLMKRYCSHLNLTEHFLTISRVIASADLVSASAISLCNHSDSRSVLLLTNAHIFLTG
jgi:hypothetical protein